MTAQQQPSTGTVTGNYQDFRLGDPAAFSKLWEHFRHRLLGLARKTLSGRMQRVSDAEDALQSAFVSFWQRADKGDFGDQMNRDDLWNVLGLITVRKALKHQRSQRAQKRGGGQQAADTPVDALPAGDAGIDFALTCEELLEQLEPELRIFALLRMMGAKNREIADQLSCTERKVERKLQLIRETWNDEIAKWSAG
jgi:DNA-directed RNA polymerase specialized sigma24 family protein